MQIFLNEKRYTADHAAVTNCLPKQCAAVSMYRSLISEPPQNGRWDASGVLSMSAASHGYGLRASRPPTILVLCARIPQAIEIDRVCGSYSVKNGGGMECG